MKHIVWKKAEQFFAEKLQVSHLQSKNQRIYQELLSVSGHRKTAFVEYYTKKIMLVFVILLAGVAGCVLVSVWERHSIQAVESYRLERPDYGQGERTEEFSVRQEKTGEEQSVELTVGEREYTIQQQKDFLKKAIKELDEILPGENDSLEEVRTSLVLPESLENGMVAIDWNIMPYGIVEEDGTIGEVKEENGILVDIEGTLTCRTQEYQYITHAKLFPPRLTKKEAFLAEVQKQFQSLEEKNKISEYASLPKEADGNVLIWKKSPDTTGITLLFLSILAAVSLYFGKDQKIHKLSEERKNQLAADYPDLMWKMVMLLGAGLTIQGAFIRISDQYNKQKNKKIRYLYEEMNYTCNEMKSGIAEAEAYERFGRRCQLPEYIRFGSYLSQNLKKGSRGLSGFLEHEAVSSLEIRKKYARKMGERAGTKLLMPMILMLGIVLAVLMVPAFLSL